MAPPTSSDICFRDRDGNKLLVRQSWGNLAHKRGPYSTPPVNLSSVEESSLFPKCPSWTVRGIHSGAWRQWRNEWIRLLNTHDRQRHPGFASDYVYEWMNCLALLEFSFFNSRIVKITGRMTWDITGDNGQKTLISGISFLQRRVGACPIFFLKVFFSPPWNWERVLQNSCTASASLFPLVSQPQWYELPP